MINYDYYTEIYITQQSERVTGHPKGDLLQAGEFDFLFVESVDLGFEGDVCHLDLQDVRDELRPLCLEARQLCTSRGLAVQTQKNKDLCQRLIFHSVLHEHALTWKFFLSRLTSTVSCFSPSRVFSNSFALCSSW